MSYLGVWITSFTTTLALEAQILITRGDIIEEVKKIYKEALEKRE